MAVIPPTSPEFTIRPALFPTELRTTQSLFSGYAASLGIDLTFQNFDHELSTLPGLYTPPSGCLFLAFVPSVAEAVGCVALRPLPNSKSEKRICEMKRLYTLPKARGLGIGRALAERVLEEARDLGYVEVRLDTLDSMVGAKRLYESLGFREIEAYYKTPLGGTIFLGREVGRK
ncbi:hypothetical protein B7494_g2097 [Chlorociboria aeruginascens]|nr:hypothetical protein B7494_g2097 [Chlorociboria aeruginascens]